jgi:hypothetical protein
MIFPPSSKHTAAADPPFQQYPNHTLGGFSAEYKVLRLCSSRLLTESAHYRMNSRFTRELFQLLSEANTLQRSLLTAGKTKERGTCVTSKLVLHEDIVNDWRTAHLVHATNTTAANNDSSIKKTNPSAENTAGVVSEAPLPTLTVSHLTATSLLITWANIPEDEDWNSAVQRAAASGSNSSSSSGPTPGGGGGLSASVGGLLASIKGTLSFSQPNHTSFSLYITPIYRTFEQAPGGQEVTSQQPAHSRAGTQEAETTLVMPFVTPHGSHKVDLLDPGKLI